ncbi:MAG: N-acetylglucosamine-6-phosphate deacetylase [Anaerolineaceae bacterium]|nr:N-acetylglucosamine-6-phosphate deacetylase [Anaerolineaceae bacterium]
MSKMLILNARIYTPGRLSFAGWLLAEDEKISDFGEIPAPDYLINSADEVVDAQGMNLLPGFIDIHTHGCLGCCTMDADSEKLLKIAGYHAAHGVTTFLPTTMTADTASTLRAIRCASELVGKSGEHAKIAGLHLEGPYFNAVKCGAQDTANIRRADAEECRAFLDAGIIKRISIAPEYPENLAAAEIFRKAGVSVSAGHTNALYADMKEALNHGFRSVTHLYNGMSGFTHREPGAAGAALTLDAYSVEIICDNIHSHPAAQNLAWRTKGADRVVLITDQIRPSGLPDGHYPQADGSEFIVSHNGTELRIPSGALAGSALTMERGLKNFTANAQSSLEETWRCASLNPARLIGIDAETGSIEKGKLADLVLMDADFNVKLTIIEGQTVYLQD